MGYGIAGATATLAAGDIEIGSVEVKDGAADIRQTVLAASTAAAATDLPAVVALHPSSTAKSAGTASATTTRVTVATDDALHTKLGEVQATPTSNTVLGRLKDLLTGIVLAAGSAIIGKVGIDQTTDGTTNLVAAKQSGTWTVQPGNTANTTAWKVDGSAVTQPASVADGGDVTQGALADAVVAAGATGSISAKLRAISRDIVANIVLAAGSSLIGRAVADASAATGGIPSTGRLLSAAGASGDATNVKNAAGRVYAIQGANVATSARYLKLYNSASAPTAGSGTPVKTLYLPPSSAFAFDWPLGLTFSAGIGFTLVTGSADNSSTSVTAADILALNIDYA